MFDWQDFIGFRMKQVRIDFLFCHLIMYREKFLTMNVDWSTCTNWSTQVNGSKHVIIMRNFEVDRQPEAHGTQGFSFQYCSLHCSSFPIDFCFYGYAV